MKGGAKAEIPKYLLVFHIAISVSEGGRLGRGELGKDNRNYFLNVS